MKILNKEYEIQQVYNKLEQCLIQAKESNKNLVYIDKAVIAYLEGKHVRRYITQEIFDLTKIIQKLENKRVTDENKWKNTWVYNDLGKKISNHLYDVSELCSPIEAFEKSGFCKYKLWEIKDTKQN